MRRPTSVLSVLVVLAVLAAGACSKDDHQGSKAPSSTTSSTRVPDRNDPKLQPALLSAADLPPGFTAATGTDNTITAFCAGQDAVAGLQASARAFIAFTRTPAGAGVVHLVFRFHEGDGAKFVDQGTSILNSCSNVPDIHGLAFTYEASAPAIDAALAGTDGHISKHGTSVGRGNLGEDVAIFRRGEVGELVAVLTNDLPRDQTDALALAAVTAAVRRAPAG